MNEELTEKAHVFALRHKLMPGRVWEDWELRKAEQFGDDWRRAKGVLADRQDCGIHMLDPSPNNICFR